MLAAVVIATFVDAIAVMMFQGIDETPISGVVGKSACIAVIVSGAAGHDVVHWGLLYLEDVGSCDIVCVGVDSDNYTDSADSADCMHAICTYGKNKHRVHL